MNAMDPIMTTSLQITEVIGNIPYRMAFAGGWIDQPFVSKLNPDPPGSMVVVSIYPTVRFMEFSGMGTSTRKVALDLWGGNIPDQDPAELVRQLYATENKGKTEPSGSQDMAGIVYPGISRLDYDYNYEGGYFPVHVESNNDPEVARWLEEVIYMVPIAPRPIGYNPLAEKNLDPDWIRQLSQSGKDCYHAILARDIRGLGSAMNCCMECWETILPHTVKHPALYVDLKAIMNYYQKRYAGAMYSGCGGGYLYIVSEEPVPGAGQVKVRINTSTQRWHGEQSSRNRKF
jgi:hypothetical protein